MGIKGQPNPPPKDVRTGTPNSSSSERAFNHAPMSGRIVDIFCSAEQALVKGSPILAMEAMKMEYIIKAPEAGQVTQFHVQTESFIEEGRPLFDFQKEK